MLPAVHIIINLQGITKLSIVSVTQLTLAAAILVLRMPTAIHMLIPTTVPVTMVTCSKMTCVWVRNKSSENSSSTDDFNVFLFLCLFTSWHSFCLYKGVSMKPCAKWFVMKYCFCIFGRVRSSVWNDNSSTMYLH